MIKLFYFYLLLSGIASLTYQVVWVRLLGVSMGSTSASISTVLAAFFFGLAIGSYFSERVTKNSIDNLLPYIVLEAIIAVSGIVLLPILINLDAVMVSIPLLGASIPMKFFLTMILLSIPTIAMGATFPVMASILIRRQKDMGVKMSQLYSLNTAGAVFGAALSGFVFIPNWGLDGAIYIAVSINVFIVITGLYFNKKSHLVEFEGFIENANNRNKLNFKLTALKLPQKRALVVLFVTGFVSISCELAWTKYLSIFTGTTIYGFAAILTIFLIGISTGSWAIKNYIDKITSPSLWLSIGLILLGSSILLSRAALTGIPFIYDVLHDFDTGTWLKQIIKYSVVFLMLFIPTFIFGALFPINLKLYCGNLNGIRARIGKAYAVNTLASILGAVSTGFLFIPLFGTDQLLTGMALSVLVLPIIFIPLIKFQATRIAVVTSIVAVIFIANWLPHLNYHNLIRAVDYNAQFDQVNRNPEDQKYLFLKEGKTGVVSMMTYDDKIIYLQNNGLTESLIDITNENNVLLVESLLGLIPYFLHPNPESAFVVGFGGGITTKALSFTNLKSIHVVELEPAVIDAGRAIVTGEIPVLLDPRVSIEFNDARNSLLLSPKKYDIIASQPSHPWLAHAATVFTQEFFTLIQSRLTEDGIFSQWVSLFNMDTTTLKSILKAFYTVFPEGMTFANLNTGDFILLGSNKKLVFDFDQIENRMQETKIKQALNHHNIKTSKDLMYYFALSRKQAVMAAHDVPANTDLNILSEIRLSGLSKKLSLDENPYVFLRNHYSFNVRPYFDSNLSTNLEDLGIHYLTRFKEAKMAQYIANQLVDINPVLGRGIEYEILWQQSRFKKANEFYYDYKKWPDRTHKQQALFLSKIGRKSEAKIVLNKIKSQE
jgi:spermidine synthase